MDSRESGVGLEPLAVQRMLRFAFGTGDRACGEWTRVLAHARLVVISDAGHYPHAEQPEQFFPAVEAFLAGTD